MDMKILACVLILTVSAYGAPKTVHREHGPHVHGAVQLNIAFDELQGLLEIDSPAESILGFEHRAQSEIDKKAQRDSLRLLDEKIGEMLVFDPKLECKMNKEKIQVVNEGSHADVEASFKIGCSQSPVGSRITFNFQFFFPNIKTLDVTVLVGTLQKTIKVKSAGAVLELQK
jgi:hypothetical protein